MISLKLFLTQHMSESSLPHECKVSFLVSISYLVTFKLILNEV